MMIKQDLKTFLLLCDKYSDDELALETMLMEAESRLDKLAAVEDDEEDEDEFDDEYD